MRSHGDQRCARVGSVIVLVACAIVQVSDAQPPTASNQIPSPRQAVVELEHEQVRVTVLPGLGGRGLRYIDKATGKNHSGESTSWYDAGVFDKEGNWPNVNFSGHAFQYDVKRTSSQSEI